VCQKRNAWKPLGSEPIKSRHGLRIYNPGYQQPDLVERSSPGTVPNQYTITQLYPNQDYSSGIVGLEQPYPQQSYNSQYSSSAQPPPYPTPQPYPVYPVPTTQQSSNNEPLPPYEIEY
jgi:hypothetical protein